MSYRLECTECGIEQTEQDQQVAHDLAEGHADRHGHRVEVEEVDADE